MASPYTYEQLRARQKLANQKLAGPLPVLPSILDKAEEDSVDTSAGIDEAILNEPAIEDSATETLPEDDYSPEDDVPVPPGARRAAPAADAVPQTAPVPVQTGFDEKRAKRALVLHQLRNSKVGVTHFASHLRKMYKLPKSSKLTDLEVLQAAYDEQSTNEPDLTPGTFEKDLHAAFGDKVDKALLRQAHEDYPGITDESALVERMYRARAKKLGAGPVTDADKIEILRRRFPKDLDNASPDNALLARYKMDKLKGRDVGSYDDYLHGLMSPTLAERASAAGGTIAGGLISMAKDVGTMAAQNLPTKEHPFPYGKGYETVSGAIKGEPEAVEALKATGKGAVTLGTLAAGPAVSGGVKALEGAMGAAKTAPLLTGALEGAVVGGAQTAGTAAVEGKPLGEVLQSGVTGAAIGAPLGAVGGKIGGDAAAKKAVVEAAQAAAEREAAAAAGAGIVGRGAVQPAAAGPVVTDALELAARAQAEQRWGAALSNFAKEHEMDMGDVRKLVEPEVPATADLAAAATRNGVSIKDINELKTMKPGHVPPAPVEATAQAGAVLEQPPVQSAPKVPPAPETLAGAARTPASEKITEALKKAEAQLPERAAGIREQRSARFAAGAAAARTVGGLEGYRAKLSKLFGKMDVPEWEGLKISPTEHGDLHDAIQYSTLLEGDKLTAGRALEKLIMGGKGGPTASEIRALRLAFGDNFAAAAAARTPQMSKWLSAISKTLNTPRTAMTTLDLSPALRQGYLLTSTKGYWRAVKETIGNIKNIDKFALESAERIKNDPLYKTMEESGVYFQGKAFEREGEKRASETFAGSWIDDAPAVKQSQGFYDTVINEMRANVFRDFYQTVAENGGKVTDPHFRESLAHWVNTASGRGNLGPLARAASVLNQVAFSPRLAFSRLETFNPGYYWGLHPTVRSAVWRANVKTIGATTALLGMLGMSGAATVGLDPRSSDFAKARVGNTRFDMFAGHQQLARMAAQMITGKVISSTTGREIDLNGSDDKNGFSKGSMTRLDVLGRFMEAKSSPLASLVMNQMRGKDFLGRPLSIGNEIASRLTPMIVEDVADAYKDAGFGRAAAVWPAATIGIGASTYNAQLPKAAGGQQDPDYGIAMTMYNHIMGHERSPELRQLTGELAEQWVKDAAMAQVMGHHEATQVKGFWDSGSDQKGLIRKATARRMARVNKLYKDLTGANGEQKRLAAQSNILQLRHDATGMDMDALADPQNVKEEK